MSHASSNNLGHEWNSDLLFILERVYSDGDESVTDNAIWPWEPEVIWVAVLYTMSSWQTWERANAFNVCLSGVWSGWSGTAGRIILQNGVLSLELMWAPLLCVDISTADVMLHDLVESFSNCSWSPAFILHEIIFKRMKDINKGMHSLQQPFPQSPGMLDCF